LTKPISKQKRSMDTDDPLRSPLSSQLHGSAVLRLRVVRLPLTTVVILERKHYSKEDTKMKEQEVPRYDPPIRTCTTEK
jgi:hypothetical protein